MQVVLASAGFEAEPGSQQALLGECQALATTAGAHLWPALTWQEVPAFLAGAAVTIVPSARETFGNLAMESLSAGTPVVAYTTGNLPALLDGTGQACCSRSGGTAQPMAGSAGSAGRSGTVSPGVRGSVLPVTELPLRRYR